MSERFFSEDEVAKVIRRAAELEAERAKQSKGKPQAGLSVQELEEIASASGIDPELIRQAANELDTEPSQSPAGRSRSARSETSAVVIDGSEIYAEEWIDVKPADGLIDLLIAELNHKYGTSEDDVTWWNNLTGDYPGKARVKRSNHTTEWIYTDAWQMSTTRVLFQGRGDRLRIRVSKRDTYCGNWENYGNYAWVIAAVLMVPTGILGHFAMQSAIATALMMAVVFVLSFGVGRTYLTGLVGKEEKKMDRLSAELGDLARELGPDFQKSGSTSASQSRRTITIDGAEAGLSDSVAQKAQKLRNQLR